MKFLIKRVHKSKKNKGKLVQGPETPTSSSSIKNFFTQSSQSIYNDSFSPNASFNSAQNGTMIEIPEMISVLEARKKTLEQRKEEISCIKDEQIKNVLLNMIDDMKHVVEDSDRILKSQNELIKIQTEDSEEIQSNANSVNNLTKGIGNLKDGLVELNNRVQSLEVAKNCTFDSQFLNIVFVNSIEADCIENGTTGPKQKFTEIMSTMKIIPPRDIVDANLISVRRFVKGSRKQVKMLRVRFSDSVSAGQVFSKVIIHNKSLADTGNQNSVKYYAEMPASKNVWNLKRICYELKNEGTFVNVRGSERGILVTYKMKDTQDETKDIVRNCAVTSEKEIDDLRKLLNVEDAYVPVSKKYDADFWEKKRKPESAQKRGREHDDSDSTHVSKKPTSNIQ